MKNKKVINSLNKVLPNESCKSVILNNILTNNKKRKINFKLVTTISTFLILFSLSFLTFDSGEIYKPQPLKILGTEIIYKGICYQELGIYNGSTNDLKLIETSNEFIMGDKIYQKNDSIIFQNSENYIEYVKCERN